MKLIDQKGRVFGKINIIDLAIILLVLFALAFIGYKISKGSVIPSAIKNEPSVSFEVTFKDQDKALPSGLKIGDKLIAGTDFANAAITDFSSKPSTIVFTTNDGKVRTGEDPTKVDIKVTISAKALASGPVLRLEKQELFVGNKFILKTQTIQLDGKISSFTNLDAQK